MFSFVMFPPQTPQPMLDVIGMPLTSSMGCGVWGGNITNENIALKHYMNVTWVSRPIAEDRPSEQELFGEFYNSEIF